MADRFLIGNGIIEEAIAGYQQEASAENIARILNGFRKRMNEDGHLMMPVEMSEAGDGSFEWLSMTGDDGKSAFVVFTSEYEANKGPKAQFLSQDMHQILKYAMNMECEGIMLNPFGKRFLITKAGLAQILEVNKEMKDGRHLDVVQGDITTLKVDAIVNAANSSLLGGGGVDGAIHRAAGMELLKECETLGGCNPGEAKLTKGYNLDAKFVIHTVGPIYSGSAQDAVTLANCYRNSLNLARENDVHTIAFPSISTGVYGYPVAEAAFVACKTILEWLSSNKGYAMDVTMVCFDGKTFSSYDMASGLINAYTHADEYLLEAMKDGLSPTVYTDWKINEMPEETASGVLQREMSARDLEVLSFGHIPQEMEDKWFWYADNGKLYAYRNGSGNFVFALDFLEGAVENKIHVTLNNDDEQREWTDLDEELHHVEALLNEWCKLNYDYYEQWLEEKRRIEDKPEALIEMDLELVTHNFTPIYDEHSRILMLGTMPSPKSREVGFYYGHPRNRFWKVVSAVCGEKLPLSTEAKIDFALRNHIAVWDVLAGCEIKGADDSSIRNPRPNDLRRILKEADIRAIFATGQKAAQLYKRYCYKDTGMEIICLPSTSPANCRVSDEELFDAYRVITKYL